MSDPTLSLPKLSSYTAEAFQIRTDSEVNPRLSAVESESYAWFNSYGIFTDDQRQKFTDSRFSLLASLVFPKIEASRLRIATDFALWYFSFQYIMADGDAFKSPEEMRGAMDAIMRAVNDPDAPSSNFQPAAMLQSCFQRMVQDQPPLVAKRFVTGLGEYTNAHFQARFGRATVPTLEECIEMRRGTTGMNLWSSVFRYAQCLNLPDQVVDHESLSELDRAGVDTFNLAGDIYSSVRVRGGAHPLNIVSVVMHHNNLDLQGSIRFVEQLMQKRLNEFKDIKAKLPSFGAGLDEQVTQYAQVIERCNHGQLEWALTTPALFGDQTESVRETGLVNLEKLGPA